MSLLSKLAVFLFGVHHCFALSAHMPMQTYSQASQDQFVYFLLYELLDKQDDGYYLEIGAADPSNINNSYFFEKNFGWKGVSIDISDNKKAWYSARKNLLLIEDATQSDYHSILKSFPQVIDYLTLDIDGDYDLVLQRIPFNDHLFKIITIEHDSYRYGDKYRKEERRILESLGYYLLCPDVSNLGNAFEDWWIHPNLFPADVLSMLTSLDLKGKSHGELINITQSSLVEKK